MTTPSPPAATAERTELYTSDDPLILESGQTLAPVTAAWECYGRLNRAGDNAILVCHALTGSAHAADYGPLTAAPGEAPGWWNGAIGPGKAFDPERYAVFCINFLGSCYGSTGPLSIDPATGRPFGPDFPEITVRDMVRVQMRLLERLGVTSLAAVAGGSLGGMQALEWAVMVPDRVRSVIAIATAAQHSAWAVAFNEVVRQAIMGDPEWQGGRYDRQPARGLALARMMAMISYRSAESYQARFGREPANPADSRTAPMFNDAPPAHQVSQYLRYQGRKLSERFDANTYLTITRAMDRHDLAEGRGPLEGVLGGITCPALCVGISSDVLYPPAEQKAIAAALPNGRYAEIDSPHGHDAFLIEWAQMNALLGGFLAEHEGVRA